MGGLAVDTPQPGLEHAAASVVQRAAAAAAAPTIWGEKNLPTALREKFRGAGLPLEGCARADL